MIGEVAIPADLERTLRSIGCRCDFNADCPANLGTCPVHTIPCRHRATWVLTLTCGCPHPHRQLACNDHADIVATSIDEIACDQCLRTVTLTGREHL